jgi:hypothetical protein
LATPWALEDFDGVQVLRLRAPKTKDINYVSRTINEFLMPFAMLRNLRRSPLAGAALGRCGVVCAHDLFGADGQCAEEGQRCRSYLIIRDIFPEWAVDMGLMGRGLPYRFFKAVERYQYSVADVIGVQTPGNMPYLAVGAAAGQRRGGAAKLAGRCARRGLQHFSGGRATGRAHGVCLRRQHGRGAGHGHPAEPGRAAAQPRDVGFLVCGARQRRPAPARRCRSTRPGQRGVS